MTQPAGLGARTRSPGAQHPRPLPGASSGPPQDSPPPRENRGDPPPPRLKKSFEIFVRKPTASKPKPPPRKYFKSDCDPPKSPEERQDLCPPAPTVPARAQVRAGSPRRAGPARWSWGSQRGSAAGQKVRAAPHREGALAPSAFGAQGGFRAGGCCSSREGAPRAPGGGLAGRGAARMWTPRCSAPGRLM